MSRFNRILCPVDLSNNSFAAIKLASTIAKEENSKIVFIYIAPQWLPDEAMFGSDYVQLELEHSKRQLEKLKPAFSNIEFEHVFRHGNPGPEIVKESRRCDMVVMSTHGYGAMLRLLMGSVAQYTMRNAKCPVVMVRLQESMPNEDKKQDFSKPYVTEVMQHVSPIREHELVDDVLKELDKSKQSAAPVIDVQRKVIGILTKTDIDNFRSLQKRFEDKDPSVVKEMFQVDKYGHVRPDNQDFNQVKRHMSAPVVTISNHETVERANEIFSADPTIHHLVVVDEHEHVLGIVEPSNCRNTVKVDVSVKPISK